MTDLSVWFFFSKQNTFQNGTTHSGHRIIFFFVFFLLFKSPTNVNWNCATYFKLKIYLFLSICICMWFVFGVISISCGRFFEFITYSDCFWINNIYLFVFFSSSLPHFKWNHTKLNWSHYEFIAIRCIHCVCV